MFFNVLKRALAKKDRLFLSKLIPFATLEDKYFLTTYAGNCVSVIAVSGKDYNSIDSDKKEVLFNQIKSFLIGINEALNITIHISKKKEHGASLNRVSNNLENEISTKWNSNFAEVYTHDFYIVVSSSGSEDFASTLLGNVVKPSFLQNKETIKTATDRIINLLEEFKPYRLEEKNLIKFYFSLINGFERDDFVNVKQDINDYLAHSTIEFNDNYMTYSNGDQKLYSKWLSIVAYENDTDTSLFFRDLLSVKAEFTIYQNFQKLSQKKTKDFIVRREKHLANFHDSINNEEFEIVKDALLTNEEGLYNFSLYVQVFGENLKDAEADTIRLYNIIEKYGYNVKVEDENIQLLYHANIPETEHYLVRKRVKVATNLACLNSFEKNKGGFDRCSFGDLPTTKFFTSTGDVYNFVFHESERPQALGNTLIIGGSSSGKTTLTSFLIGEALAKYPSLVALAFDKHRGMQVFTEILNMKYTDFNDDIHLNPLNLNDTPNNRDFLLSWFLTMTKKNDIKNIKKIEDAVNTIFTSISKADRNLENAFSSFGISESDDSIVEIIRTYIGKGANSRFFSDKDSLDFKSRLATFNIDSVFRNPDALALISQYVFHKLYDYVSIDNNPFLIFVDESLAYFHNETFAKKLEELTLEIRKKNGIIIFGAQNYKQFHTNSHSRSILGNSIATIILFPDPTADENFKETFNLTDTEFEFIKNNSKPYHILVKKPNINESVILNVNLSSVGNYLKCFDSSSETVARLLNLKKKHSYEEYREIYLKVKR